MIAQATLLSETTHQDHVLKKLTQYLQNDLDKVNTLILKRSQSPVELVATLAKHLIAAGGKRIRPLLTLACAKLFEYQGSDHIKLATAVEFIHTATLLHDDVVDDSELRRGRKTANNLWGNEASVLVGDFLFSQAFKLMVETQSLGALDALSSASSVIAEGEVKQLLAMGKLDTSLETYFKIIEAKTAELFKASCKVGSLLCNQPEAILIALGDYGRNLGMMFQITDDILDYFGSTEVMGKSIGNDFKEGKITLPLILLYNSASRERKLYLKTCFSDQVDRCYHFEQVSAMMHEENILDKALEIVEEYGDQARKALSLAPSSSLSLLLGGLVDYCFARVS